MLLNVLGVIAKTVDDFVPYKMPTPHPPTNFAEAWLQKNILGVFDAWVAQKQAAMVVAFWDSIDGISMVVMCVLQLISIFGFERIKKYQVGVVAGYVALQFLKNAWHLL